MRRSSRADRTGCGPIAEPPKLDLVCLWDVKSRVLEKSGLVSIHRRSESFDQLGGMKNLEPFGLRAMRRQGEGRGNETGRPTVVLDVAALLGSFVGQSESNVRTALRLA